jgi:hypothetical protein
MKTPTTKAIGKFHARLSRAQFYQPAIDKRLSRYWCQYRVGLFFYQGVDGYKKPSSPNDPEIFGRASQLIEGAA